MQFGRNKYLYIYIKRGKQVYQLDEKFSSPWYWGQIGIKSGANMLYTKI